MLDRIGTIRSERCSTIVQSMLERSCLSGRPFEYGVGVKSPLDERIAVTLDTMERQMSERLRVRDLAALVRLSPGGFAHLFQVSTGMSPARYLRQLRMGRARDLIDSTALPIREVMRLVGLSDPGRFSKDFRRRFGKGPAEYRRYCRFVSRVQEREVS
jgi:transcriptional regulator GlxA family with amidase domain